MTTILLLLIPLALSVVLLYGGRGFLAWLAPALLALGILAARGALGGAAALWTGLAVVAAGALLGPFGLRRALVAPILRRALGGVLPRMSETEREALEAGTVWWDAELFSGNPRWQALLDFRVQELSPRERAFLDGPVEELCRRCDDWQIRQDFDLPDETLEFIKAQGFMGMIVPEEYGGLGFSAAMNSAVVAKVSSRSVTAAVTIMVPNSLGPAELLHLYGTPEQKERWLPRLASGEEVPCFALTEPHAGSDAGAMRSSGVVCRGEWEGEEVLGIRLDWDKRYITLSTVATLIGLAFKLHDPDHLLGEREDLGITVALVPAHLPGVETGRHHDPMGVPFFNGPTRGKGVFVPLENVIGGAEMVGQGWGMLMQCLSAGRGISLPALATGASQLAARTAGAYATVREQFNLPIGRFEGIEERLARIGGLTYLVDSARWLTHGAVDAGEKPAVVSAIVKLYSTEIMRAVVNDAMDVLGGAGICRGPRNVLAGAYQAVPIGITVEGANILTRSMIIYGQGAIRCHPWVQQEMRAVAEKDDAAFDRAFFGHVNFVFQGAARSFLLGLTNASIEASPAPRVGPYFQHLGRLSASFALVSDAAMATLGGSLKRREAITGRLADALGYMFLASAALKRFCHDGQPERDEPALRWSVEHALFQVEEALAGVLGNLPSKVVGFALRPLVFPVGRRLAPPSDRLGARVARGLLEGGELREALTTAIHVPPRDEPGLGTLERALELLLAAAPARAKLRDALKTERLAPGPELTRRALDAGVLTPEEAVAVDRALAAQDEAVQVDAFGDVRVHARPEPSTQMA